MEVGREIYRRNRRIKIIFQTKYGQFCKDAVNFSHAFAYLEKPLARQEVENQSKLLWKAEGFQRQEPHFTGRFPYGTESRRQSRL